MKRQASLLDCFNSSSTKRKFRTSTPFSDVATTSSASRSSSDLDDESYGLADEDSNVSST